MTIYLVLAVSLLANLVQVGIIDHYIQKLAESQMRVRALAKRVRGLSLIDKRTQVAPLYHAPLVSERARRRQSPRSE